MPIHVSPEGHPQMFEGSKAVRFFRMVSILSGMKAELRHGMRLTSRAPSCFTIVRREFGLKGNKQKLLEQFEDLVTSMNAEMEYERKA